MCGDSTDITPLQIGDEIRRADGTVVYSLHRIYNALSLVLNLNEMEQQESFTLEYFQRLASIAARNGFEITTQSPFQTYYQSILRSFGRSTNKHKETISNLAKVLGSPDGALDRSMDAEIAKQCVVSAAAIFPLLSKLNHSCSPNVEVQDGIFVDCHVDLVATRDIGAGEELVISYINLGWNVGRNATRRRNRLKVLHARYLFWCDCPRCHHEDD